MRGLHLLRAFGLVIVGLALLCQAAVAVPKSADVVKVKATAGAKTADGGQKVNIVLDIAKPYHIYANPVKNADLDGAQTVISFRGVDAKVNYPAGHKVKDSIVGEHYTYEGTVNIEAMVYRAQGSAAPLEFTIRFQACDDKVCLTPGSITVKVD